MKKPNYYKKILSLLEVLHKEHPYYDMGQHLATAIDGDKLWSIPDNELYSSLHKYQLELNMDTHREDDIEDIIKDGLNLNNIYLEEQEEE